MRMREIFCVEEKLDWKINVTEREKLKGERIIGAFIYSLVLHMFSI